VLPHIQSGALRALAVTAPKRMAALPDVPALAEFYPGYDGSGWQGFFVPAATPKPVIDILHRAATEALADRSVRERLTALHLDVIGNSPEALSEIVRSDHERWGRLIREAGIRTDG
jgi:tripartite-type tricarboxylate transporter receptor subunit TctC